MKELAIGLVCLAVGFGVAVLGCRTLRAAEDSSKDAAISSEISALRSSLAMIVQSTSPDDSETLRAKLVKLDEHLEAWQRGTSKPEAFVEEFRE